VLCFAIYRLVHGNGILMGSHGKRPMGWDRHKLLRDRNGTDKYVPWTTLGLSLGMSFLWESHGKRPMEWVGDGTVMNYYGMGTRQINMSHGQPSQFNLVSYISTRAQNEKLHSIKPWNWDQLRRFVWLWKCSTSWAMT